MTTNFKEVSMVFFKIGIFSQVLLIFIFMNSCTNVKKKNKTYYGIDAELYKETPAWNLVHYMDIGDWLLAKEEIKKDTTLAKYVEPIYGNSILFWAALKSNENAVKLLINSGAEVNHCNFSGESPLQVAAFYNKCNSGILPLLLAHQPTDDSLTLSLRNEALVIASKFCLNNVKLLINYGADPEWISLKGAPIINHTPLSAAVVGEQYDIVEYYLFELKVNPSSGNIIGIEGDTILMSDILQDSYNRLHSINQEKTRQQIIKIQDFLKQRGYKSR